MRLILASKSPRRREILSSMGYTFDIVVSEADETLPLGVPLAEGVRILAERKGEAVLPLVPTGAVILSSDTLVDLDGEALGKPTDEADARRMLRALSGKKHFVHTGVAVRRGDTVISGTASTGVVFRTLSDEEIDEYVSSGHPMDKAGSYGIQGPAGAFVERIEGDFDTVVGLSSALVSRLLSELGKREGRAPTLSGKRERLAKIIDRLKEIYPEAECALQYEGDPWRLLIMGRLSAQCTDARVNIVSRELFAKYPTPEAVANADLDELCEVVRPCGLYRTKGKSIKEASRMLVEDFGGRLPDTMEELLRFEGVGRKIANLLLGDVFGKPAIVTDTHCIRICGRLGMYPEGEKNPYKVEKILTSLMDLKEGSDFCHRIVTFGREVCTARSPKCNECPLADLCLKEGRALKRALLGGRHG